MKIPLRNGIAHGHIVEGPIHADIAHRGKARQQRDAGVGDGLVGRLGGGLLEHIQRLRVAEIGEVRVAVDQAGQHRHGRQIDALRALGHFEAGTDGLDLAAADHDELIRENAPRFDVDELAGADDGHRGGGRCLLRRTSGGEEDKTDNRRKDLDEHDAPFGGLPLR